MNTGKDVHDSGYETDRLLGAGGSCDSTNVNIAPCRLLLAQ